LGHGDGADHRARLGLTTAGPTRVITDLCVLEPDRVTKELTVTSVHPGVSREDVSTACGWKILFAEALVTTPAATDDELGTLRDLQARTRSKHSRHA